MPDIILWNSIAHRRRSPSDTFLENGLGILKTYVEKQGYQVQIIDWACNEYWEEMTPKSLLRVNRYLSALLLSSNRRNRILISLVLPFFLLTQTIVTMIQKRTLNIMLRKLAESIRDSRCNIVGIKVWYGEAYQTAKALANWIHILAPEILIVAGGPHASIYREAVLEDNAFDIAVIGEGEKALAALVALDRRSISKNDLLKKVAQAALAGKLKNIIYKDGNKTITAPVEKADANHKVIPTYENMEGKTRIHVLVDALGCPWGKCNFCVHSCIYPDYTVKAPESVVDEIEAMIQKDIGFFRFAGSTSSLDHVCDIARSIEKRELKIIYSMFARSEVCASDDVQYRKVVDAYRLLIRTGLRAVFIGGETGDEQILDSVMGKGVTLDDIKATIRAMREASDKERIHLDIGLSLIYPSPTKRITTLEKLRSLNLGLVNETQPDSVLINPPAPFPGTAWFNNSEQYGFELDNNFTREMLNYEYVLYKPPFLWPDIDVKLDGMTFRQILGECQILRKTIEERGFVTEVTDEHFLMMRATGYNGKQGSIEFKQNALLDILSCDYRWINEIQEKINHMSKMQAQQNMR